MGGRRHDLPRVGAGHARPGGGGAGPAPPGDRRLAGHWGSTEPSPIFGPCWRTSAAYLGDTAEGLQALDEAHTLVEQHEECWWEAEICRLRGVVAPAAAGDHRREAEACFLRALEVARRQEAKSLELRAAMSLSQLWQHQGKCAEARALLAPIYGWFTEGFDTADLQEARTLLEELAG